MIILYVLLVMAVAVLGNENLEDVCPYDECFIGYRFSDKPAPKINRLQWRYGSDLKVVKATPNLVFLEVYNCRSDFKMDIFPQLPALKRIKITNCSISELQKHQFENVINLDYLKLTGNSIEILSNETFHNLSLLTVLDLENNLIQELPEGVFNPLESLYSLILNNNNISMLPKDIFLHNLELQVISLNGNPLKILSLDIYPKSIGELNLIDCVELKDLRLSVNLTELYLQNSGVERLQFTGRIWKMHHENSKVTRADLSGTFFRRQFEQAICDMPSLEWLDLSNSSQIYFFVVDDYKRDCKFPNLRSLNLTGNKLDYIPRRLPLFGPNLTIVDFSHNLLDDFELESLFTFDTPRGVKGYFPNLRFLYLAHNKLKKFPRICPLFGPSLTILDLSYNLLEDVLPKFLANAPNLQSLYLEGNQLKSFYYLSVCDGLKNLKRLTLYDNMFDATFYHNMTKYLGDKGLSLFEK